MIFKIEADYRSGNPKKPTYYVVAETSREAKKKFKDRISWLKIYSCEEYSGPSLDPAKHIIIGE